MRKPIPGLTWRFCQYSESIRNAAVIRRRYIAFLVNARAGETAEKIYHDLYQKNLFPELWFKWQGKPLLLCDPAAASAN